MTQKRTLDVADVAGYPLANSDLGDSVKRAAALLVWELQGTFPDHDAEQLAQLIRNFDLHSAAAYDDLASKIFEAYLPGHALHSSSAPASSVIRSRVGDGMALLADLRQRADSSGQLLKRRQRDNWIESQMKASKDE